MCWPTIGWSFVRGKSQIAMVAGRACRVVVDEESFIQHRQSVKNGRKKWVVVNQDGCSREVPLYSLG